MGHVRSCPHDCKACKKKGRWFVGAWMHGGCIVCGVNRGPDASWACDECWNNLGNGDHALAQLAISEAQKEG
jgi:hypothetical protein